MQRAMCRKGSLYLYTYSYGMKSKSCGENTNPRKALKLSTNKDYRVRIVTKMNSLGAPFKALMPCMLRQHLCACCHITCGQELPRANTMRASIFEVQSCCCGEIELLFLCLNSHGM